MNLSNFFAGLDFNVVAGVSLIGSVVFFVFCKKTNFHQRFPRIFIVLIMIIAIPCGTVFAYKYVENGGTAKAGLQILSLGDGAEIIEFSKLNRTSGEYYSSGDILVGADKKIRIKKGAVDSENIKNKSIENSDLSEEAVDSRTIRNGSITGADISLQADLRVKSLNVKTLVSSGAVDMDGEVMKNIGSSGTDFTSSGGLNLADDFKVDGDAFFVDSSNGYVGIGTTEPKQRLDIQGGQIGIGDGDDKTQKLIIINTGHDVAEPTFEYTESVFGIDGLDGLTFSNGVNHDEAEDGFLRVRADDANGYLIAQTTDTNKSASVMAVYDEENDSHWGEYANKFILRMSAGAAKEGKLQYQYGTNDPDDAMVVTPPTGTQNGIDKVYFPSGNVGIGTDNPVEKLTVNGDIGIGAGVHEEIDLIKVYAGHAGRDPEFKYVPNVFGQGGVDGVTFVNGEDETKNENGYFRNKAIGATSRIYSHTTVADKSALFSAIYNPNDDGIKLAGAKTSGVIDPAYFGNSANAFSLMIDSGAGKSGKLQYQYGVYAPVDAMVVMPTDETTNDINKIYFPNGSVGIGTSNPSSKLEVNGGDIRVTGGSFIDDGTGLTVPDYVFEDNYKFLDLASLGNYIEKEQHLPGVPDMNDHKGWAKLSLQDRDMTLLEKTEENTLYILQNYDAIDKLKKENEELKNQLKEFEKKLADLENKVK